MWLKLDCTVTTKGRVILMYTKVHNKLFGTLGTMSQWPWYPSKGQTQCSTGTSYVLPSPFLWMVLNCFKATEPLQGESSLFTTKSSEFLALILSNSEGWKAESTLGPPSGFEPGTPGLIEFSALTTWPLLLFWTLTIILQIYSIYKIR